jgi:hypothetical protein
LRLNVQYEISLYREVGVTAVTILHDTRSGEEETYWAIAPNQKVQTVGRTAGEALDALNARLSDADTGTLIVVQRQQPDSYFSEVQIRRLQELMDLSNSPQGVTIEEEAERDALIEAEFLASAQRTAALADAIGR